MLNRFKNKTDLKHNTSSCGRKPVDLHQKKRWKLHLQQRSLLEFFWDTKEMILIEYFKKIVGEEYAHLFEQLDEETGKTRPVLQNEKLSSIRTMATKNFRHWARPN